MIPVRILTPLAMIFHLAGATAAPADDGARTYVYQCSDQYRFTAQIDADRARLYLVKGPVELKATETASGVRFVNDDMFFWSKGEEALLDIGDKQYRGCRNDAKAATWEHARLNGVEFRAIGNEPGWTLEISNQTAIEFVTDYGQRQYQFEADRIRTNFAEQLVEYRATADAGKLRIITKNADCADTMSDDTHPSQVTIQLDDHTYHGCGRPLEAVRDMASQDTQIENTEWVLRQLHRNGKLVDVPTGVTVSLLLKDGRATGKGGCNQYFASYRLNSINIGFADVGSTKMACPDPAGDTETAYFALLGISRIQAAENGALQLMGPEGEPLLVFAAAR